MADTDPCQLYLITPPRIEITAFSAALEEALGAGDVGALQVRLKDTTDEEICRAAEALLPICHAHGVSLILNDRADLAAKAGCDGVHIGQQDGTYQDARKVMGSDKVVGVTCHASTHLAMEAGERGADYVAFGAFFPTGTKATQHRADPDILAWWNTMMVIPSVAIGGITVDNCAPLVTSGADFLAVISGVWDYPDGPGEAVRAFNRKIAEAADT